LDLAGAVGDVAGLRIPPLGLGAASGIVVYFVLAIAGYLRVGEAGGVQNSPAPLLTGLTNLVRLIAMA
jgi:hypothetical protein